MKQYHVKNMQQVFVIDDLPKTGFELKLKATGDELKLLAEQMNVEHVASFTAELLIKQWRRGGAHIEGKYSTTLTQQCVISLDSFVTSVEKEIDQKFFSTTKIPDLGDKKEIEMLDNDMDPPEALVDGKLDILDYLVEVILLELDPYPKKPDSRLESLAIDGKFEINQPTIADEPAAADGTETAPKAKATHKPFADLAKLLKDK